MIRYRGGKLTFDEKRYNLAKRKAQQIQEWQAKEAVLVGRFLTNLRESRDFYRQTGGPWSRVPDHDFVGGKSNVLHRRPHAGIDEAPPPSSRRIMALTIVP